MNEKDIYKGLNHIDEDLIDEAKNPLNDGRKPAGRRLGKIGKTNICVIRLCIQKGSK